MMKNRSALALALLLASCSYRATIRRTSHGIPHIVADDLGNLGFGEGYAFAEDHLCSLADQVVRARGERAHYFGRGEKDRHLLSDVAFRALRIAEQARSDFEAQPAEIREWLKGYAAGYNHYLGEIGVAAVPGWCRGQAWVRPITPEDVLAYARVVVLSGTQFASMIATAGPPGEARESPSAELVAAEMDAASNGWAIGSERSESGRGMLFANPHYPWVGSNRFWEKQLTIPGQMDVYGVHLLGLPGVAIGFNRNVAWTHTVSAGRRFTGYRLTLVPGSPTSYLYDGKPRAMSARHVTVEVREEDGSLSLVDRTLYFTHYGPVLNFPGLPWTTERAVSFRDANEANDEALATWLAMDRARSLDELKKAHADPGGVPFVNTIAASADGRAWYADGSAAPGLRPETVAAWLDRLETDPETRAADERGMMLLDGASSRDEWLDDARARDPGVVPFDDAPQIERRDYVFNANDSYWMPHATARLVGFSPAFGRERTSRSLRTRKNALVLKDRHFSLETLTAAALENRGLAAELLLPAVVERCKKKGTVRVEGRTVRIAEACAVLSRYDGRVDLDSVGAVIWREFLTEFEQKDLLRSGSLFARDFDPEDPVGTPRDLAPSGKNDRVLENLGRAVEALRRAGIALDTPLGDVQTHNKYGDLTPVHGGIGLWEGVTNQVGYAPNGTTLEPGPARPLGIDGSRFLTSEGYPINNGTSFLLALEFTATGPRARALLTHSESGDPDSPFFSDQTALFSEKKWRPVLFTDEEIRSDVKLSVKTVSGRRH